MSDFRRKLSIEYSITIAMSRNIIFLWWIESMFNFYVGIGI